MQPYMSASSFSKGLLLLGMGGCCLSYVIHYKFKPTTTEEIADALIEHCGGLNGSETYGDIPLMKAAGANDINLTKLLIAKGANIEIVDNSIDHATPLLFACHKGSADTVAILLENGAEIEARDDLGKTPLIVAALSGSNASIIDLLLDFHADIDNCDREGMTALAWASKNGNLSVVKLLVNRGATIDSPDFFHTTPLIWACWKEHWDIADYLIQKGADINAKNKCEISPLKASIIRENSSFAEKLIKLGAEN